MNAYLKHLAIGLCAVMILAAAPGAQAGWPTKVATENPGNKNPWGADPDPWQPPDTPVPTAPGTTIWIAIKNWHIPTNVKTVSLKITPPAGVDFNANEAFGYYDNGAKQSTLVGGRIAKVRNPDGSITFTATLDPQPSWEVFKLTIVGLGGQLRGEQSIPHEGNSNCVRVRHYHGRGLVLGEGTHNGAMDVFAINDIFLYPENGFVDVNGPVTFVAPPHTGEWYSEFVDETPDGEPLPQGGVRYFTYGPGLQAEDVFGLNLPVYDTDGSYWMYMFDQMGESGWQTYLLGTPECPQDLNGDGDVDLGDLAQLLSMYGAVLGDENYDPAADFNDDGMIGLSDLASLLSVYGTYWP